MLDLLQILVMALHLTAVNAAFGGPILALWLYIRSRRRSDSLADALGLRLLRGSMHGLYSGMVLGIIAAWLWYSAQPREVLIAFESLPRSRYYFTIAELGFSAVCFEAWIVLWRTGSLRKGLGYFLAAMAITNTVYHFPTLFSILSVLSSRPAATELPLRYVHVLIDPEVVARVTHFTLASLAVAGAMLMALATAKPKALAAALTSSHTAESASADLVAASARLKARGAQIALVATLLQWPVGVVVMLQLPEAARDTLLGYHVAVTLLFALSLGAVVMLMHRLATASFGESTAAEVRSGLLWLGITIAMMTAVRHLSREPLYLAERPAVARFTAYDIIYESSPPRIGSRT